MSVLGAYKQDVLSAWSKDRDRRDALQAAVQELAGDPEGTRYLQLDLVQLFALPPGRLDAATLAEHGRALDVMSRDVVAGLADR